MPTQDALWKSIIEDFFEEMMAYFYPEKSLLLDFSTVKFLDQELQELSPNSIEGKRYADKLVQLSFKEGVDKWILIHVEVQGYTDHDFAKRMFTYFYRILDRFKIEVEAIAIYADGNIAFHPSAYLYRAFKTSMQYRFHTYKILDQQPQVLNQSPNPFAMVILTVREFIQKRKWSDDALLELKRNLFRNLLNKGFQKDRIYRLIVFLQHYVSFNEEAPAALFQEEINQALQRQPSMGIIELIREEMLQEAREKGKEQGIEKGLQAGESQTYVRIVSRLLKKGFSPHEIHEMIELPLDLILEIQKNEDKDGSNQ